MRVLPDVLWPVIGECKNTSLDRKYKMERDDAYCFQQKTIRNKQLADDRKYCR